MTRTILHIGSDKTGTSTIQAILTQNRMALRDAGVWYPDFDGRPDHQCLVDDPNKGSFTTDCHTLVLSFEGFWSAGPANLAPLLDRLPHPIEVHAWVRSPVDYLDAAFRQRCRNLTSEHQLRLLLRVARLPGGINPIARRCVRRFQQLEEWSSVFGEDLRIHDYSSDRDDIVTAFFRRTGIASGTVSFDPGTRINTSPSLTALHALMLERARGANPDPNTFLAIATELGSVADKPLISGRVASWCEQRTAPLRAKFGLTQPGRTGTGEPDELAALDRDAADRLAAEIQKRSMQL